jgi:hypothetical protein
LNLSEQVKILAKGINPDTGELLDSKSIANSPDGIRFLFSLAEELSDYEKPKKRKNKLTPEQRIEKNIKEGKPPKSHFSWEDEEKEKLKEIYSTSQSIELSATELERSVLAIAVQLEKLSLITIEEVESYRT